MTEGREFEAEDWIARLAGAIEDVVSISDVRGSEYSGPAPNESAEGNRRWRVAQYRSLAHRSRDDAAAARVFASSHLHLEEESTEAQSILLEHDDRAGFGRRERSGEIRGSEAIRMKASSVTSASRTGRPAEISACSYRRAVGWWGLSAS